MARVLQQRGGPPYLLIAFVFLFLISTTLAVLFYIQRGNAIEEEAKADKIIESLASPIQLKSPRVVQLRKVYETAQRLQRAPVVLHHGLLPS